MAETLTVRQVRILLQRLEDEGHGDLPLALNLNTHGGVILEPITSLGRLENITAQTTAIYLSAE